MASTAPTPEPDPPRRASPGTVLVTGAHEDFVHRTVACLAADGFEVVVGAPQRFSSMRASKHVHGFVHVPWPALRSANDRYADIIDEAVARHDIDLLFPADVAALRAFHSAARRPDVATVAVPTLPTVELCDDKMAFARFLDEIGCPQPADPVLIEGPDDLDAVDSAGPFMVKPLAGGGGIGVCRIDTIEQLRAHVGSDAVGSEPPLLVQEYVPGSDIDMSFYAEDGEMLVTAVQTRRRLTDPEVVFVDNARVTELSAEIVRGLGYCGLGHIDLRIDDRTDDVVVIEINPRVWGSVNYALFMGVNFPAVAARRALGLDVELPDSPLGSCRNPGLSLRSLVGLTLGRPPQPPASLNAAELVAFRSTIEDPWPLVTLRLRQRARRAGHRIRASLP